MEFKMKESNPLKVPTFREIIKIAVNRKNFWDSQTPLGKWCYLYGIGRLCISFTGFTVFEDDQTLKWYAYLAVPGLFGYLFLAFYTVFYYTVQGEFVKCLPSTCMIGLALSMVPLLILVTFENRHTIHSLVDYSGRHIYQDYHESTGYNRICSQCIDGTVRDFFIKMGMMFLSYFVAMIGPMRAYFFYGIRTTTTEIKFPFVAEKSDGEFIGNVICQACIGGVGMLAYTGLEIVMAYIDNFATPQPEKLEVIDYYSRNKNCSDDPNLSFDEIPGRPQTLSEIVKLVEYELQKLDRKIEEKQLNKQQIEPMFSRISKHAVDADKFTATIRDLLYSRTLITPAAMSIFCQFTMNYAAGYGMGVITFVQLFYICELGDSVENNGFDEIIYASKWYNLPIEYQRDIVHLIHQKQNSPKITVGPFADINRELTTVITKRIYSFIMFLFNFTK